VGTSAQDAAVPLACARHIASVAAAAGAEHWPQLRPAWEALLRAPQAVVLQAAVEAAPALAAAVGPAAAAADVLPGVAAAVGARLGELKRQVAGALGGLVAAAPPELHDALLVAAARLAAPEAPHACGDWRMRKALAEQLGQLAAAVTPQRLAERVEPVWAALAQDPAAAVRSAAAGQRAALDAAAAHGSAPEESPGGDGGNGGENE